MGLKPRAESSSGCEQPAAPCSALNPSRPFFSQLIFISSGSVTSNKRSVLSNHALPSSCHPLSTPSPARLLSPHRSPRALEKSFSARLYSHITGSYSSPASAALPLGLPLTITSSGTLQIQSDSGSRHVCVRAAKQRREEMEISGIVCETVMESAIVCTIPDCLVPFLGVLRAGE